LRGFLPVPRTEQEPKAQGTHRDRDEKGKETRARQFGGSRIEPPTDDRKQDPSTDGCEADRSIN
jgi:hypothetical protein